MVGVRHYHHHHHCDGLKRHHMNALKNQCSPFFFLQAGLGGCYIRQPLARPPRAFMLQCSKVSLRSKELERDCLSFMSIVHYGLYYYGKPYGLLYWFNDFLGHAPSKLQANQDTLQLYLLAGINDHVMSKERT